MNRLKVVALVFIMAFIGLITINCGGQGGEKIAQPPALNLPTINFLEQRAKDIGVSKDESGHLVISGIADVRFQKLLAYFNAKAKFDGKEGKFYPYKVSGFYKEADMGPVLGYQDHVHYDVHFSFDEFVPSVDLAPMDSDESRTREQKVDDILLYLNTEAANSGREYKFKAQYSKTGTKEKQMDRVDIFLQLSFESERPAFILEILAAEEHAVVPFVIREQELIGRAAVLFSEVLEKPEALTITTLDFLGNASQSLQVVYVFDEKDVRTLTEIRKGDRQFNAEAIIALSEAKKRASKLISGGKGKRLEEIVVGKEASIVAELAVETARLLNPSHSIEIVIHNFYGISPTDLITWAYVFNRDAIVKMKSEELTAKQVLELGQVQESRGAIPGNREIPPGKRVIIKGD